ncbi:MAG: ATP-binding protein [Bacteroidota bacterium]
MSSMVPSQNEFKSNLHFKSRARLLPQLGDMLIKSEEVAFLELIKNSYDADATEVTVLMENIEEKEKGIILIEDNGFGMNRDIIENVWLELGSDHKALKVQAREKTPLGRIPIGEKGIGRLGAHKLGDIIELVSKKENDNEVTVKIDWREFNEKEYLEDVIIVIVERKIPLHFKNGDHGTFISICNLKTDWSRKKLRSIQRSITSITNPFEESNEQFKPSLQLIDKPGWLEGLISWDEIKDFSLFSFSIIIEGTEIKELYYNFKPYTTFQGIEGREIEYKPNKDDEKLSTDEKLVMASKSLKRKDDYGKDIGFSTEGIGEIVVKGEIFDFEAFIVKDISDKSGLKQYVRENSGVKVYRGDEASGYVRVYDYGEPGNDWLGLNLKRVNVPVNLSNNLIVSGVFLNREKSLKLKEKTNREGFIEDKYYENFRDAVLHGLSVVDVFRKADKKRLRDKYGPKSKEEPVHSSINKLRKLVDEKIKDKELNTALNSYIQDIEESYNTVYENLLKTASAGLGMGIILHEVEKVIAELIHLVKSNKDHKVFANLVKRLSKLVKGYSEIFRKSNKVNIELHKVIEDALFSVAFRLKAHEIEVIKGYSNKKHFKAKIAKGLIEGTLINLIDNSIYWLQVAKDEHKTIVSKKIFIDLEESKSFLSIIIADNGTGFLIPINQAISPMESGKPSGGWGLGLHIANEIMLSHGGNMSFPEWDPNIPQDFKTGAIIQLNIPK